MSDENEKLGNGDDEDFEGHKIADDKVSEKMSDKLSPATDDGDDADFEGHKLTHDKLEG